jgi:hypothetical protein
MSRELNQSARADALLKEEAALSKAVQEVVDEYIASIRAPGVPKGVLVNCEFGRFNGRLVHILEYIRDRAR